MESTPVEKYLLALIDSLGQTRASLAWLELKQSEWRSGDPPVVASENKTMEQLRDEESRFLSLAATLHDFLNRKAACGSKEQGLDGVRHRLLMLERDFHCLEKPKPL